MSDNLRRLAAIIGRAAGTSGEKPPISALGLVPRKGVVVSASGGRAVVTVGGDTTQISDVPKPAAETWNNGDVVFLLQDSEGRLLGLYKIT